MQGSHLILLVACICLAVLPLGSSSGVFVLDDRDLVTSERAERAQAYHHDGLQLAMEGKYEEALELMRGSVRNNGYATNALNDLGVTEMRKGLLHHAKRRFWRCLHVDPSNVDCSKNCEELRRYLGEEEYNFGSADEYPQTHTLNELREVSAQELKDLKPGSEEAREILNEPFVVRNALQSWGWENIGSKQFMKEFSDIYPEAIAEFYPHGMTDEQCHPFFAELSRAYNWIFDPVGTYTDVDASEVGTIVQWNLSPELWDHVLAVGGSSAFLPEIFSDKSWKSCMGTKDARTNFDRSTHWKMLIGGERHSGMFNHKDYLPTASYQVQLEGRKGWHLCSPSQDPFMYEAGDVDAFKPDYGYWPDFKKASCLQTTLYPGDLVYYPENYWHQTLNLDTPSVALSSSVLRDTNFKAVAARLKEECDGAGAIFPSDDGICDDLEGCLDFWNHQQENSSGEEL